MILKLRTPPVAALGAAGVIFFKGTFVPLKNLAPPVAALGAAGVTPQDISGAGAGGRGKLLLDQVVVVEDKRHRVNILRQVPQGYCIILLGSDKVNVQPFRIYPPSGLEMTLSSSMSINYPAK